MIRFNMKQHKDNFVRILASFGETFEPDQLESPISEWFIRVRSTASTIINGRRKHMDAQWSDRPLHVIFVHDSEMNAYATKSDIADYIILTDGAVETLFGTMCGLMSSPSFLSGIGDLSKEEEPQGPFPNGLPRMPLPWKNQDSKPIEVYRPSNIARMAFALQLAEDALQFLIFHELGHILGGHLEMFEAEGMKPLLLKAGQPNKEKIPNRIRPVLEYDADIFAAHANSFIAMHPEGGESLIETFEWSNVAPQDAGAILYLTAVAVLFRLLESDGTAPEDGQVIEYPHPTVRSNLISSMGLSLDFGRQEMASEYVKKVEDLLEQSVIQVELIWSRLDLPRRRLGPRSNWAYQISKMSGDMIKEYKKHADIFNTHARLPITWHGPWPES